MKCLTLFTWIVAGTMVAAPAAAQVTPPAPPRPETAPTPRPMRAPRANEWPNDLPLRLEPEQQELEQRRQERRFDLDLTMPRARPFDVELPARPTPAVAPLPPLPPVPAASSYVETNETRVPEALDGAFLNRRPPAPWAAHDPPIRSIASLVRHSTAAIIAAPPNSSTTLRNGFRTRPTRT